VLAAGENVVAIHGSQASDVWVLLRTTLGLNFAHWDGATWSRDLDAPTYSLQVVSLGNSVWGAQDLNVQVSIDHQPSWQTVGYPTGSTSVHNAAQIAIVGEELWFTEPGQGVWRFH
jgi:hypothetical protein